MQRKTYKLAHKDKVKTIKPVLFISSVDIGLERDSDFEVVDNFRESIRYRDKECDKDIGYQEAIAKCDRDIFYQF